MLEITYIISTLREEIFAGRNYGGSTNPPNST